MSDNAKKGTWSSVKNFPFLITIMSLVEAFLLFLREATEITTEFTSVEERKNWLSFAAAFSLQTIPDLLA